MFRWKNRDIDTVGALVGALSALSGPDEAQEFMQLAREDNPQHADANVGYCIGYIGGGNAAGAARRAQIHEWVGAAHPVFGGGSYGVVQ